MDPITLAAIAFGGAVLLGNKSKGASKGASKGVSSGGWGVKGDQDRLHWLNEIRAMSYWYTQKFGSMPLLADYLTVVGYIESRFNPASVNPQVKTDPLNAARGLAGMRPRSAFKSANGLEHMRSYPNALLNPRWAFVTSVDFIWQACDSVNQKGSGVTDWAAVRRWWGFPSKVHDFNFEDPYSAANLGRFEDGLNECNDKYGTGINPDFVWQKVQGWENYPGMSLMVKSFGLQGVNA